MKKLLFLICFTSFFNPLIAQHSTFIKSNQNIKSGTKVRVVPASDKGWFLFTLDSFEVFKYNNCGQMEWGKKFTLPNIAANGTDIIPTKSGGFAFMLMDYPSSKCHAIIVNADAQGTIIWSKSIDDPSYSEVPYTILQDEQGNFYLYGNVTLLANLAVFNSLTKISPTGNIIWSKLYNHGGTWGGAILTSDKGFLLRTGSKFIKTDANGDVLWSNQFFSNMYHYIKPVEVADGYIFNGYQNFVSAGDSVAFLKINKSGAMQWGGKKLVNFRGEPQDFKSKYNGNFIFLHNKPENGKFYSSWTEFDKDLNSVNQSAIGTINLNSTFHQRDICFLADSSAIIAGFISTTTPSASNQIGFIKSDPNQHITCDTSFSIVSYIKPIVQNNITTNTTSRTFTTSNQSVLTESTFDSTKIFCTNLLPLEINIGNDTILCEGSTLSIKNNSKDNFDRFIWSTGETTSQIFVTKAGKYWLRAINSCRLDSTADTIQIAFNTFPTPNLVSDTAICSEQPIVLIATISSGSYLWNNGSTEPNYFATLPGIYFVDISYLNCVKRFEITIHDCEILTMPNVITPNNDALNNSFIPIEMQGIIAARLTMYNRWGEEIYETSDILNRPWVGRTYSKKCPDGVYFWIINYTNYLHINKVKHGNVSLFGNE